MHDSPLAMRALLICVHGGMSVSECVCMRVFKRRVGLAGSKTGGAGANDTYPSAVGRVVMHDDIGQATLAPIPFDLAMIKTRIPKTRGHMLREHGKKMRGKGRKGFPTYPHARHDNIVIWAIANLDDRIGLYKVDATQLRVARVQTTKEWPIHGVARR